MIHSRAAELLGTARNADAGKPLQNNTRLHKRSNGDYAVRLHNTDVVTIHADGTYTLDSGRWQTVTTKERINSYSPARLYQRKGEWFLQTTGGDVPFVDGIRVDANGEPLKVSKAA